MSYSEVQNLVYCMLSLVNYSKITATVAVKKRSSFTIYPPGNDHISHLWKSENHRLISCFGTGYVSFQEGINLSPTQHGPMILNCPSQMPASSPQFPPHCCTHSNTKKTREIGHGPSISKIEPKPSNVFVKFGHVPSQAVSRP